MNLNFEQQFKEYGGKIVWIASYPKSGNTWVRCLLTALFNNGELDINNLDGEMVFENKSIFEAITNVNPDYLSFQEYSKYKLELVNYWVANKKKLQFVKSHKLFKYGEYNYINKNNTHAIIYIVRNPLDIASSFANHINQSTDASIYLMNKSDTAIAKQKDGLNTSDQLHQPLGNWSDHVCSWLDNSFLPVILIRYEDLKKKPHLTFSTLIEKLGLKCSEKAINQAIEATSFQKLQEQESKNGFKEKSPVSTIFFRKGEVNNWSKNLTTAQIQKVIKKHRRVMKRINYDTLNY